VAGFGRPGPDHPTALIRAGVGLLLGILGALALQERFRKHAMHAAAFLALLGFMATGLELVKLAVLLLGWGPVDRPAAVISKSVMAITCLVFVLLCLQSFIAARNRQPAPPPHNPHQLCCKPDS